MKPPRAPTVDELAALAAVLSNEYGRAPGDFPIEHQRVAVFDEYITDGPGYYGRVAVVVWPGGPELVESFVFDVEGNALKAAGMWHEAARRDRES